MILFIDITAYKLIWILISCVHSLVLFCFVKNLANTMKSFLKKEMKVLWLLVSIAIPVTLAVWSIDMDSDVIPCMPNKTFNLIDATHAKFSFDPKVQKVFIDGNLTYVRELSGIIAFNFSSLHKAHRSIEWKKGDFNFYNTDMCHLFENPLGQPIIYMAMKKTFKKPNCPFPKGVRKLQNFSFKMGNLKKKTKINF